MPCALPRVEPDSDSADANSVSHNADRVLASCRLLADRCRHRALALSKCLDVVEDTIEVDCVELDRHLDSGELSEMDHGLSLLLARHGTHEATRELDPLSLLIRNLLAV